MPIQNALSAPEHRATLPAALRLALVLALALSTVCQPATSQDRTGNHVRFIQISDTHIITAGGTCHPAYLDDGRTDCQFSILEYASNPDQWIDPLSGVSVAPTIALGDAVAEVNRLHSHSPIDFVVFTGDIISNMDCAESSAGSYRLFKQIADGLEPPYYLVGADSHDGLPLEDCRSLYEETFGAEMVNWHFVIGKNLFIGLSEIRSASTNEKFDTVYARSVLDQFAFRGMRVFLFFHSPIYAYDEIVQENFRTRADVLLDLILPHTFGSRELLLVSGHNHANIIDRRNAAFNLYQVVTTSLINYPTEFRLFQVDPGLVRSWMSPSVNSAIDHLSLEIMAAYGSLDPRTFYGLESDRNLELRLLKGTP